jgi:hypothetical protein
LEHRIATKNEGTSGGKETVGFRKRYTTDFPKRNAGS